MSKARDDLPEPEMPVNTMSRSRGSSRSTFFRLCSRAPRTVIVGAVASPLVAATEPAYPASAEIERMFVYPDRPQLALELRDLVAQTRRFLEPEILGGLVHLLLQRLDEPTELVRRDAAQVEDRRARERASVALGRARVAVRRRRPAPAPSRGCR